MSGVGASSYVLPPVAKWMLVVLFTCRRWESTWTDTCGTFKSRVWLLRDASQGPDIAESCFVRTPNHHVRAPVLLWVDELAVHQNAKAFNGLCVGQMSVFAGPEDSALVPFLLQIVFNNEFGQYRPTVHLPGLDKCFRLTLNVVLDGPSETASNSCILL